MKIITEKVVGAFLLGKKLTISNTESVNNHLYLFGNLIARKDIDGVLHITNAGWPTNTTKERLNALPGVSISQKKGIWYLNGEKWGGNWVKIG